MKHKMVVKHVLSVVLFILFFTRSSESARILAIMPTPSYSHQIVFNPLWLRLNARGHHVTLFTTNPIKGKNLSNFRQIDWGFAYDLWLHKHNFSDIIRSFNTNLLKCLYQYAEMMSDISAQELQHPEVQQIIKSEDEHFDLVIVEILNPAMIAFSERFKCPFIGVSPMDITNFVHESVGNPISPALFPDFLAPFDCEMNFFERVINSFYYLGTKLYFKYYFFPKNDQIVKEHFGWETPNLEDIQKNASLIFLNVNPIIHNIRPLMGNVLAIGGGTHLGTNSTVPSDIQNFLDKAEVGVIYFSLGSNVKSKDLPETMTKTFLDVFSELPYKVLWKFEDTLSSDNGKIMTKQWIPQQQILAHPNIKVFITQGGLQSLEEAIYNAVPIIALPVSIDQFPNVRRVTKKGLGISIDYDKVDKQTLKEAINEVITNKKYKIAAEELSSLLIERPVSGLSQAVWWTEYVLKHKGAKHLRAPEIPLYQYLFLDVFALLLLVISILMFLLLKCFKLLITFIKETRKDKTFKLE